MALATTTTSTGGPAAAPVPPLHVSLRGKVLEVRFTSQGDRVQIDLVPEPDADTIPIGRLLSIPPTLQAAQQSAAHALLASTAIRSVSHERLAIACHPLEAADTAQLAEWFTNPLTGSCRRPLKDTALKIISLYGERSKGCKHTEDRISWIEELVSLAGCNDNDILDELLGVFVDDKTPAGWHGLAELIARAPIDTLDANELWKISQKLLPLLNETLLTDSAGSRAHEISAALIHLLTSLLDRLIECKVLLPEKDRELLRWAIIRLRKGYGHGDKVTQTVKGWLSSTRRKDNSELLFLSNMAGQALARASSDQSRLKSIGKRASLLWQIAQKVKPAAAAGAAAAAKPEPGVIFDASVKIVDGITALAGLQKVLERPKGKAAWYDQIDELRSQIQQSKNSGDLTSAFTAFDAMVSKPAKWKPALKKKLPHESWNLTFAFVDMLKETIENSTGGLRFQALAKLIEISRWGGDWHKDLHGKAIDRALSHQDALASAPDDALRTLLSQQGIALKPQAAPAVQPDSAPPTELLQAVQQALFPLLLQAKDRWKRFAAETPQYIPARAALTRKGPGNPLLPQVRSFLASSHKIMLIQGDSGSGKTTAALYLEGNLSQELNEYTPHYARLTEIRHSAPADDKERFLEHYIVKTIPTPSARVLFILDGYDEISADSNLYYDHHLDRFPNAKFLFTCRTQHLQSHYSSHFCTQKADGTPDFASLQELYISPLSSTEQQRYIQEELASDASTFEAQLKKFPKLQELASLPFALQILIAVRDRLQPGARRADVYEAFARKRCAEEADRLHKPELAQPIYEVSSDLAYEMFIQADQSVQLPKLSFRKMSRSSYESFFRNGDDAMLSLARLGCLVRGLGDNRYEFLHPSLRDYFAAAKLFECIDDPIVFGGRNFRYEPQIVEFLVHKLWAAENRSEVQQKLFAHIQRADRETPEGRASSNAATLLCAAGVGFSGREWQGACLYEANLTGAVLHQTDLRDADLAKSRLEGAQLVGTRLEGANLREVAFVELPTIHTDSEINCVAHHPTLPQCALALLNGNIEVWDTAALGRLFVLQGHKNSVESVAYSPDGKQILSGSGDKTLRQWDALAGGEAAHTYQGHTGSVTSVAYSPDGKQILSGSKDTTLRQWDALAGGEATHTFQGHIGWVMSVAYSPDGKQILSGSSDKTLRQWDVLAGGETTHIFQGHTDGVWSVVYSPDGKQILSGSWDNTLRQWDAIDGGESTHIFEGHTRSVSSVAYSPDGRHIVSGSYDNTLRQWDALAGGKATHTFQGHRNGVMSVAYSLDGKQILSGSCDRTLRQWDATEGGEAIHTFQGHTGSVRSVAYSPDGKQILSGSEDTTLRQWDAFAGGEATHKFEGHIGGVMSVAYNPDGRRIAWSADFSMRQWSVIEGGEPSHTFKGLTERVMSVAYSPDGRRILSGCKDYNVRQWNAIEGGESTHTFQGHTDEVLSVAYSPDGERILSGSADCSLRQWNAIEGGESTQTFKGHTGGVMSVAYSPDRRHILSGSHDSTLRQWNASEGGEPTHTFQGHTHEVMSVAYSPDGERIVSGSLDNTLRIWDSDRAECLHILRGHVSGVCAVAWSRGGEDAIASGSEDQTVAVWRPMGETWGMVWRVGKTGMTAWDCQIDDHTQLSGAHRQLLLQRRRIEGEPAAATVTAATARSRPIIPPLQLPASAQGVDDPRSDGTKISSTTDRSAIITWVALGAITALIIATTLRRRWQTRWKWSQIRNKGVG